MRKRTFTLVELMVVIAIIGLLAAIVTVSVVGQEYKARVGKTKADMRGMLDAVDLFKIETGRYPRELAELWERPGDVRSWGPDPYLRSHPLPPLDPWGNEYQFASNGGRDFEIVSYGADGAPGGVDEAVDLSSKTIFQNG